MSDPADLGTGLIKKTCRPMSDPADLGTGLTKKTCRPMSDPKKYFMIITLCYNHIY